MVRPRFLSQAVAKTAQTIVVPHVCTAHQATAHDSSFHVYIVSFFPLLPSCLPRAGPSNCRRRRSPTNAPLSRLFLIGSVSSPAPIRPVRGWPWQAHRPCPRNDDDESRSEPLRPTASARQRSDRRRKTTSAVPSPPCCPPP
jgi:hypothetical protein